MQGTVTPGRQNGATFGSLRVISIGSGGWGTHGAGEPLAHVGSRIPRRCRAEGTLITIVLPLICRLHSWAKKKKSFFLSVLKWWGMKIGPPRIQPKLLKRSLFLALPALFKKKSAASSLSFRRNSNRFLTT